MMLRISPPKGIIQSQEADNRECNILLAAGLAAAAAGLPDGLGGVWHDWMGRQAVSAYIQDRLEITKSGKRIYYDA